MFNPTTHVRDAMDHLTTGAAAGAIASPLWLPYVQKISEISAVIAPILGVLWLLVQIWAKISSTLQDRKDS